MAGGARDRPAGDGGDAAAPVPIGVLLYVNRSGSTLLSRLVSEACARVFVFPEMGWIVTALVAAGGGRPITGAALLRLIADDPRRAALPLSDAALAAACARGGGPTGGVGDVLRALAVAAAPAPPAAILIKHEAFGWLAPEMAGALGDARFLHIMRDPRAVAASMRRTPVPEKPGFDMARGSLLYAARHWRDYVARVEGLAEPVTRIRYEDLADDGGRAAIARVADALGVRVEAREAARRTRGQGGDAAGSRYRVSALDDALHPRIHAPFDATRREGWRHALALRDIAVIETICRAGMAAAGYAPTMPPAPRRRMIAAYTAHALAMIRHAARTAHHYARRPDRKRALRARLGLALRRRGGWVATRRSSLRSERRNRPDHS